MIQSEDLESTFGWEPGSRCTIAGEGAVFQYPLTNGPRLDHWTIIRVSSVAFLFVASFLEATTACLRQFPECRIVLQKKETVPGTSC